MAVGTTTAILAGSTALAAGADAYNAKKSAEAAQKQREDSQRFIEKQMKQARGDLFKLYPSAQKDRQQGIQSGLDFYRESIPQQMQAFQQGNVGAQQQIAQGLPQAHNAILGGPIDYSAFQPQQVNAGLQIPQQAPQGAPIEDVMKQQPAQSPFQRRGGIESGFFSMPRQGPGG